MEKETSNYTTGATFIARLTVIDDNRENDNRLCELENGIVIQTTESEINELEDHAKALDEIDEGIINKFFKAGGVVAMDGNLWGAVIGDMPEHKAAAFEKAPVEAIIECMREYKE